MPSTSRIFLSHAAKDKLLADALVDLLGTGMSKFQRSVFDQTLSRLAAADAH